MTKTSIEWTDRTWNPLRGCRRVSPGCENCYAERMANRLKGPGRPYEGLVTLGKKGPRWTGKTADGPLNLPLHWRKPSRIFVNSMSDLFLEDFSDAQIAAVFGVMAACSQHTFQVLTKRPARMLEWFGRELDVINALIDTHLLDEEKVMQVIAATDLNGGIKWPLPNVWLGVSIEDQQRARERIPLLLQVPAAKRFISYEPALELVDFIGVTPPDDDAYGEIDVDSEPAPDEIVEECEAEDDAINFGRRPVANPAYREWMNDRKRAAQAVTFGRGVHWLIVGGESGPSARPFDVKWARNAVRQCRAAGVPVFVKQLGAVPIDLRPPDQYPTKAPEPTILKMRDRKGGNPKEWPRDIQIREYP